MTSILDVILVALVGAASGLWVGFYLWYRGMCPAPGEAPEDDGAAWDAGVLHVCWQCGARINGPADGLRVPDRECWDCHCARYVPGDECAAVPNYVARRAE